MPDLSQVPVEPGPLSWLKANWIACTGMLAAGAIVLAPLFGFLLPASLFLIYLIIPCTMIHQVEENAGGRFRHFVNSRIFQGREILTPGSLMVGNMPVLWCWNLLALYTSVFVAHGCGLIAAYAAVINALIHIALSIWRRSYTPGLVTALLLLLPIGLAAIATNDGGFPFQLVAFVLAAVLHLLVLLYIMERDYALRSAAHI